MRYFRFWRRLRRSGVGVQTSFLQDVLSLEEASPSQFSLLYLSVLTLVGVLFWNGFNSLAVFAFAVFFVHFFVVSVHYLEVYESFMTKWGEWGEKVDKNNREEEKE